VKRGGWYSFAGLILGALAGPGPAAAQWSRVLEIPVTEMFTVWANGDTIAAGADSVVFVSTDAGLSWVVSTRPVPGVTSIQAVRIRDGRLYAGTFGQGVHVSDDLGATWHAFNEGLVGGILDTQLDITDFQVRADTLYTATAGAGVYARSLKAGGWRPFGVELEPNQAANVDGLEVGGGRLLAAAGSNGMVFTNDSGKEDWTVSDLDNQGVHAGLHAEAAIWTGTGWVVGTNLGTFRSSAGQEPWTRTDPGLGGLVWTAFAGQNGHLFAAFNTQLEAVMEESADNGATWQVQEIEAGVLVQKLAISGNVLYAARNAGLWRRPLADTAVKVHDPPNPLRFTVVGPQPFGDRTRIRFELSRAETISIDVFDIRGRWIRKPIAGRWPSGPHELYLDAEGLGAGVFLARLTAGDERQVVRLVHVR